MNPEPTKYKLDADGLSAFMSDVMKRFDELNAKVENNKPQTAVDDAWTKKLPAEEASIVSGNSMKTLYNLRKKVIGNPKFEGCFMKSGKTFLVDMSILKKILWTDPNELKSMGK